MFQNARIDKRSDKDFKNIYFPSVSKDGNSSGDFVDGKITLDTENGKYTLSKEWGSRESCTLKTPDGDTFGDPDQIASILKEVLQYGEGVYSDMLFSSQRNTDISLQTILDASKKTDTKQEITNAVSKAFTESDGITADAIEKAINEKITELDKHWDADRNLPARKSSGSGRREKGLGEILKAYYEWEDAEADLSELTQLENKVDVATADYTEKDKMVRAAKNEYERFSSVANKLAMREERRKSIDRLEKESEKFKKVLSEWPDLKRNLEKAVKLKNEKENREIIDKYESAKVLNSEIDVLRSEIENQACPSDTEIKSVRNAQKKITELENQLCGMNLNAMLKMYGGNSVNITSVRTGQPLDIVENMVSITEAVKITIPDVMEMQLSPADVDVSETERAISEQNKIINDIFALYNVEDVDDLENLARKISDGKQKIEMLQEVRLPSILGTISYAELESKAKTIPHDVRQMEDIEKDIITVCRGKDVASYKTEKETIDRSYAGEYGSIDQLRIKEKENEAELTKAKDSMKDLQNIPEEYINISDSEGHLRQLQNELKFKQDLREEALKEKVAAEERLEQEKKNLQEDPEDKVKNAKRKFEEQKQLLDHWLHISKVFTELKRNIQNNPMQDISDSFVHYLDVISNGKITSEFPDSEKLNPNIYSGNKLLDYGKLSEGSKETVSLAFRLAVLDHLFPDGGVIVLDDPLTDMDNDRTAQSCELIKECATRHQVIFLTCKEEYLSLFDGKKIRLDD
ncbi:MAG: hypothetical protein LUH57_01640 [Ruminococcus sp.]|nr:hypothetical protein [Ruminococcus sp.]